MEKNELSPKWSDSLMKVGICDLIHKHLIPIIGAVCTTLVLCFGTSAVFCQENEKIKLGAFDYPPFYVKETNKIQGIGVDLGNELFKRLHLETEQAMYPLKRALIYMEKGFVDGTMILVKTSEREQYILYSDPIVPANGYIWSAADREGGPIHFERLEDLRPYKIGATIGYSYGPSMDEFLKSTVTDSAPEEYYSFKKLMAHRVDIVPATAIITKSMIKRHPEFHGKFVQSKQSFHESSYYMGVSRKSRLAQMMPLINKTIADMKAEGVINGIIEKYTE